MGIETSTRVPISAITLRMQILLYSTTLGCYTVLTDKPLYCNAKCCLLYCVLAKSRNYCFKINFRFI